MTFANNSTIGSWPFGLFVDTNNTVYASNRNSRRIAVWSEGSVAPTRNITLDLDVTLSLFVTIDGDIIADNGFSRGRVEKWSSNATNSTTVMYVSSACRGLFVDISNTLYCSIGPAHLVNKTSLYCGLNRITIACGNGSSGSAPNMLSNPRGIFVDTKFNIYVADCGNNRIQSFYPGNLTGTTVVGNGTIGTITLNCPTGIVLDGEGYLFIADSGNHRVIGSGANGSRCIVGCTGTSGPASDQLNYPCALSFDSYGNLFVADTWNSRIQKFFLINKTCGKVMY